MIKLRSEIEIEIDAPPDRGVACAGVGTNHDALDATEEEWDEVLDVNLKGLFFACQGAGWRTG